MFFRQSEASYLKITDNSNELVTLSFIIIIYINLDEEIIRVYRFPHNRFLVQKLLQSTNYRTIENIGLRYISKNINRMKEFCTTQRQTFRFMQKKNNCNTTIRQDKDNKVKECVALCWLPTNQEKIGP
jgi:ubiquinone/menaquinone biosynthesis C-methylase UbiE